MAKKKYIPLNSRHERYLQIYHEYYVLNWSAFEISKYHECSKGTVSKALNWVDEHKLDIPAKSLLSGAVTAVKIRLKLNKDLYNEEHKKKRKRNYKIVIDLNREIREDEKLLFSLQSILVEKHEVDTGPAAAKILKLITDAVKPEAKIEVSKTIEPEEPKSEETKVPGTEDK